MHIKYNLAILSLTTIFPLVSAWGSLGHRTVAYLSTLYLNTTTTPAHFLNHFLHGQDISTAALFPDKVAHIPSFAYSRPWHYIDARDNPPSSCTINLTRDCLSDGCVVSAIANHTSRVTNTSLADWERGQSLRFVLHFIGDIHQPLHTEHEERGGNEIEVVFDGKRTNLHSVWDSAMPNKYRKREEWWDGRAESEEEAAYLWAVELYRSDGDRGDEGDDEVLRGECGHDATECALEWAEEANKWVCEYVLKNGVEGLQRRDLGGEYYQGAIAIVDGQIRRGGRRLAKWLGMMAKQWEKEGTSGKARLEVQEL